MGTIGIGFNWHWGNTCSNPYSTTSVVGLTSSVVLYPVLTQKLWQDKINRKRTGFPT